MTSVNLAAMRHMRNAANRSPSIFSSLPLFSNGSSLRSSSANTEIPHIQFSTDSSYYNMILGNQNPSSGKPLKYTPKSQLSRASGPSQEEPLLQSGNNQKQKLVKDVDFSSASVHSDEYSSVNDENLWRSMEAHRTRTGKVHQSAYTTIPSALAAFERSNKGGRESMLLIRRLFDISFSPVNTNPLTEGLLLEPSVISAMTYFRNLYFSKQQARLLNDYQRWTPIYCMAKICQAIYKGNYGKSIADPALRHPKIDPNAKKLFMTFFNQEWYVDKHPSAVRLEKQLDTIFVMLELGVSVRPAFFHVWDKVEEFGSNLSFQEAVQICHHIMNVASYLIASKKSEDRTEFIKRSQAGLPTLMNRIALEADPATRTTTVVPYQVRNLSLAMGMMPALSPSLEVRQAIQSLMFEMLTTYSDRVTPMDTSNYLFLLGTFKMPNEELINLLIENMMNSYHIYKVGELDGILLACITLKITDARFLDFVITETIKALTELAELPRTVTSLLDKMIELTRLVEKDSPALPSIENLINLIMQYLTAKSEEVDLFDWEPNRSVARIIRALRLLEFPSYQAKLPNVVPLNIDIDTTALERARKFMNIRVEYGIDSLFQNPRLSALIASKKLRVDVMKLLDETGYAYSGFIPNDSTLLDSELNPMNCEILLIGDHRAFLTNAASIYDVDEGFHASPNNHTLEGSNEVARQTAEELGYKVHVLRYLSPARFGEKSNESLVVAEIANIVASTSK